MLRRRIVGYLALVLGALGSVVAAAAGLAAIWFGVTAAGITDDTISTITMAVNRLDERLAETESAVGDSPVIGELEVRAQAISDLARNAEESLSAIDDHPLFGRLPIDTAPVAALLERVQESSVSLRADLAESDGEAIVSAQVTAQITDRLTTARNQLANFDDRIQSIGNQLRLWIRLSALAGFLLSSWGLWAQIALARRGHRARRP